MESTQTRRANTWDRAAGLLLAMLIILLAPFLVMFVVGSVLDRFSHHHLWIEFTFWTGLLSAAAVFAIFRLPYFKPERECLYRLSWLWL